MRILVLGGTQMLGRDFVERTRGRHSVVIANRGVTMPDLFPDMEHIRIDREVAASLEDYGAAGCRALGHLASVDAVVDFSCYTKEHLENTIPFLPSYGRYVYVSTMSVFDQDAFRQPDPASPYYRYCVNKVGCEEWIRSYAVRERWSVVRPCAVVGPHDYTGRFLEKNGQYFWKCNEQLAAEGTVPVAKVSEVLEQEMTAAGFRELSVCR